MASDSERALKSKADCLAVVTCQGAVWAVGCWNCGWARVYGNAQNAAEAAREHNQEIAKT